MRSFSDYFTFWFWHFVHGGELLYVKIEDKDYYLRTLKAAKIERVKYARRMRYAKNKLELD